MKLSLGLVAALATLPLATLATGCGGSQRAGVSNRGSAPRGPAIVYFAYGENAVFEADCYDPSGDCAAIRAKALAGGELVSGDARFRMTGTRQEECGASGDVGEVVSYERVSGGEDAAPGVVTFPADATIDLVALPSRWGESAAKPTADPAVLAVLAARATADLAGGERARAVQPTDITIDQIIDGNFLGGPAADRLVMATIPLPESDGPGYVWSAVVAIPDGNRDGAMTLWQSDLETFSISAHYDLNGDGVREFLYSSDYYEGSSSGAAAIVDNKIKYGNAIGCGA